MLIMHWKNKLLSATSVLFLESLFCKLQNQQNNKKNQLNVVYKPCIQKNHILYLLNKEEGYQIVQEAITPMKIIKYVEKR